MACSRCNPGWLIARFSWRLERGGRAQAAMDELTACRESITSNRASAACCADVGKTFLACTQQLPEIVRFALCLCRESTVLPIGSHRTRQAGGGARPGACPAVHPAPTIWHGRRHTGRSLAGLGTAPRGGPEIAWRIAVLQPTSPLRMGGGMYPVRLRCLLAENQLLEPRAARVRSLPPLNRLCDPALSTRNCPEIAGAKLACGCTIS